MTSDRSRRRFLIPKLPSQVKDAEAATLGELRLFREALAYYLLSHTSAEELRHQVAHFDYKLGHGKTSVLFLDAAVERLAWHEHRLETLEHQVGYFQPVLQRLARAHALQQLDPVADITSPFYDRERRMAKLDDDFVKLQADFNDVGLRLQRLMALKEAVRDFWRFARESNERYLADIASLLYDALRHAYAEEMTRSQLDGIRQCLDLLRSRAEPTLEDAQRADAVLREHGLESLPV